MKKLLLVFLAALLLISLLSVTALADISEDIQSEETANGGFSNAELVITISLMFVVISVIGVMFAKTVIKNNKRGAPKK